MSTQPQPPQPPKVDPHRHLGGAIVVDCVWDIIESRGYHYLAETRDDVHRAMTFAENEERDFYRFLNKFKILDEIKWDLDLIDRSIKSVCDQLACEDVAYCWLDFSINKYMRIGWSKTEAIAYIHNCIARYRPGQVGLVLALKYESLQTNQRQYAALIDEPDIADMLIGIDLVGDENQFDPEFYKPIFREWKSAGKMVRAHVGESQSADNVKSAILDLGVTNIAHGIKIYNDHELMQVAADNDITFDTAITSNYLTGVWTDPTFHPIVTMLSHGLKVTLGSDDPVQCSTTLDMEYSEALRLGATVDDLYNMQETAYRNSQPFFDAMLASKIAN